MMWEKSMDGYIYTHTLTLGPVGNIYIAYAVIPIKPKFSVNRIVHC